MNRLIQTLIAAPITLFASSVMAIPSLQIGDADGGACNAYDITEEDCLVGGTFTVTSLELGTAYVVFAASSPASTTDTFTIDPMIDGVSLDLVADGYGAPPIDDVTDGDLPSHGIYDTWFEVYELTFEPGDAATVYNTQPGNEGDSAAGYIKTIDMYLTDLTGGLHIDLFRCSSGSIEGRLCRISGGDKAPFSHDATYVPVPAAVWLFGSGLLGMVGIARRKKVA